MTKWMDVSLLLYGKSRESHTFPIESLVAGVGYWAFKYYGTLLPMFPDNTDYETMELRAEAAQRYVQRHRLDEDYCLFIDYGIPSGTPRLFVWSFREQKVVARTYVMHGPGMGSTAEELIGQQDLEGIISDMVPSVNEKDLRAMEDVHRMFASRSQRQAKRIGFM